MRGAKGRGLMRAIKGEKNPYDYTELEPLFAESWVDAIASWVPVVLMFIAVLAMCLLVSLTATGCASVQQTVTTMDGDTFEQRGFSLFSKQDIAQASSAEFFPNNSGATIDLNTDAEQDSTEALTALLAGIVALGKAFGGGGTPIAPPSASLLPPVHGPSPQSASPVPAIPAPGGTK